MLILYAHGFSAPLKERGEKGSQAAMHACGNIYDQLAAIPLHFVTIDEKQLSSFIKLMIIGKKIYIF